jgi:ATP-dependent DNA helicase RecG
VLKLIATNPSITYSEIAETLSINESAVGKHITAIKNKGFLIRQGDTRGYWEINLDKN